MKKMNKKGELTTTQLVTLIILIVSFVVILFLIFRLNLGQVTDAEICKNSVILRGQSKLTSGPLDCKTQYVCISGDGDCQNFSAAEKIEVDAENKNETMKVLADKMADCWNTFGEGKINYLGTDYKGYHCAICSIIKFNEIQSEISYRDLFNYLENNDKSSSQTYLQYLFGVSEADDFTHQSGYLTTNYDQKFSFDERYSIITGRNEELLGADKVIPVYFIKSGDIGQVGCDEFVTKA